MDLVAIAIFGFGVWLLIRAAIKRRQVFPPRDTVEVKDNIADTF